MIRALNPTWNVFTPGKKRVMGRRMECMRQDPRNVQRAALHVLHIQQLLEFKHHRPHRVFLFSFFSVSKLRSALSTESKAEEIKSSFQSEISSVHLTAGSTENKEK